MSSLNSMQLQGVRSFNPALPERIKFESPVTIILGQNGSGKTTLIESLKYITTGDFPAGSKGAAFVHDPKINETNEVKGQIKLDLQSVKGEKVQLSRSMVVTQKKTVQTFKTLESLVKVYPKNGAEPKVLPGKCGELENEAVTHLGVSKAVLNNVLFCHQEDSNWPLCESKALKLRFDDIFSIKKYMKAVDNLKEIRKKEEQNIAVMKGEISGLKDNKEEADNKRKNFEEIEEKIKIGERIVQEIKEKLIPIEEQLKKFEEITKKLNELKIEHGTVQAQKKSAKDSMENLKKKIKQIYEGTDDELKNDLEDFEGLCKEKLNEKLKIENEKKIIDIKIGTLNETKNLLSTTKGKLETEVNINERKIEERQALIKQIATELNISGFTKGDFTETHIGQFLDELIQISKNLEKSLAQIKMEFQEKEAVLEKDRNEIVRKKAAFEEESRLKGVMCEKNEKEIKDLRSKLANIDASQKRLIFLDQEIEKKEKSLTGACRDVDEDAMRKDISLMQSERSQDDVKLAQLRTELNEAQNTNDLRINLETLNADKASKEEQLEKFLDAHRDVLDQNFANLPVENLRDAIEQFMSKKSMELSETEKNLKEKEKKKDELNFKRTSVQVKIEEKQNELKDCDENILQTSGGEENFDEQLQSVTETLENMRFKKGTIDGGQYMYKLYIDSLKKKACCPLCKRNFEVQNEADRLAKELNTKLSSSPAELERLQGDIKTKEITQQDLIKLQPTVDLAKKIRDKELPSLKNEKEEITSQFRSIQKEIEQMAKKCEKLKDEKKSVSKIASDISLIDSLQAEIKQYEIKIESLKRQLASYSSTSDRSLAQIRNAFDDLQQHRENLTKEIERKQEKVQLQRDRIKKLNDELNILSKERLEINENMQKRITMTAAIEKLSKDNVDAREDAEKALMQIKPLDKNFKELQEKRNNLLKETEKRLDDMNKKVNETKQKRQAVESLTKLIKNFESEGKTKQMSICLHEIQQTNKEIARNSSELASLAKTLSELSSDLDGQEAKRRDLHDNLDLRRHESDARKFEKQIEEVTQKISRLEKTGLGVDTKKFHENYVDLKNKCGKAEGSLEELMRSRKLLKSELDQDKYKHADVRYRDKFIDLEATKIAVEDVKKYAVALESALIKYHETKMKDINGMIKQLWQEVYKGGDIDYVQIKSESDSSLNKRQSTYNYRVVMYVNNHELDMRGRCSAGQKVLASILIRIALAEVFCTNCGVLALDEPTTNLDSINIESLAEALAKIIDRRSQQKNFQLVLITHDQEFVRLLIQQHPVDYYYKVSKDENGFSQLKKEPAMNILSE